MAAGVLNKPLIFLPTAYRIRTVYNRSRIGYREVVGHGKNGSYVYADDAHFPFPAIRFQEIRGPLLSVKLKEVGDWRLLCYEEKKALYRLSFCQTYAEFQHPTGLWMLVTGMVLFLTGCAFWINTFFHHFVRDTPPESLSLESRKMQLRRMLELHVNEIDGLSSKWDYLTDRWKWDKSYLLEPPT